jgi:hypothetical protein
LTLSPNRGFLVAAIATTVCIPLQAQRENVLSVDDGTQVRPIARLVAGRWVSEATCATNNTDPSAAARLKVTGELQLSALRAVVPGSPEWLRLAPTIVELFERRERDQRLLSDRTSDAPRAVDFIYVAEGGDRRMYYFEASRRVASGSADVDSDTDPPGTLRIAVAGFLHDTRDRLVPLGTKSELRWEQDGLPAGLNRPDLMPLGVVANRNQSIWVMKGQSGTSSWFTLYEVDAQGTRTTRTTLTTRLVGC